MADADIRRLQIQLVGDAGAALLALLVNVTLSVYKPQGLTPYGRRKQQEERTVLHSIAVPAGFNSAAADDGGSTSPWMQVFAIIVTLLIVVFVILHLTRRGLGALHGR